MNTRRSGGALKALPVVTPGGDPNGKVPATGSVAPADGSIIYKTFSPPSLLIGSVPAQVGFSGLAPGFAGLYQINTQVPPGVTPGDEVQSF